MELALGIGSRQLPIRVAMSGMKRGSYFGCCSPIISITFCVLARALVALAHSQALDMAISKGYLADIESRHEARPTSRRLVSHVLKLSSTTAAITTLPMMIWL